MEFSMLFIKILVINGETKLEFDVIILTNNHGVDSFLLRFLISLSITLSSIGVKNTFA